jgi:hypothetical protein
MNHWPSDRIGRESMKNSKPEMCVWKEDSDGGWVGSCKIHWSFDNGTLTDNRMNYCPWCGRRIIAELCDEQAQG